MLSISQTFCMQTCMYISILILWNYDIWTWYTCCIKYSFILFIYHDFLYIPIKGYRRFSNVCTVPYCIYHDFSKCYIQMITLQFLVLLYAMLWWTNLHTVFKFLFNDMLKIIYRSKIRKSSIYTTVDSMTLNCFKKGFLNLGTIVIWGWIILYYNLEKSKQIF